MDSLLPNRRLRFNIPKKSNYHYNAFDIRYIFSISMTFIISTFVYGLLSKITYQEIMNQKIERSILKHFLKCFFMYFVYYLIVLSAIFVLLVVSYMFFLMPIIGIIIVLLCIMGVFILSLYYVGYYRFIPYIAMTEGISDVFSKSKQCIKGHLVPSIILMIINIGLFDFFSV